MFRRILVPLDGSVIAEKSVSYAVSIARRSGARLDLVHVLSASGDHPAGMSDETRVGHYLASVAERIDSAVGVQVGTYIERGFSAEGILECRQANDADLMVVTTHGWGRVSRSWLGSTTDELIRTSPVPLLVARVDAETPEPPSFPENARVLIPLDGSSASETIIHHAFSLGALYNASYQFLRVVRPRRETGQDLVSLDVQYVPDIAAESRAIEELNMVVRRVAPSGSPQIKVVALSSNNTAESLLDVGSPRSFDLIALSTKGRSGLSRLLLGSVADKVVRGTRLPILIDGPGFSRGGV